MNCEFKDSAVHRYQHQTEIQLLYYQYNSFIILLIGVGGEVTLSEEHRWLAVFISRNTF